MSTLLLLIGYGYTLLPVDIAPEKVLLIFGVAAVVHAILVLLIKGEDDADKFHDYESFAGKILLALRLMLFVGFLWALHGTMEDAPFRVRRFLTKFGLIGTVYFIGPPFLVLVVSFIAPYWRPPILTSCLILMQIGTAWWLNRLFLSRGEFFEVSELNSSSLPGGTPRSNTPRNSPRYDRDKRD
ncbi:gpr180 [Symbiodinium pilosum]|uniref:Gpr180 protein n=1 Tax=Symbiodinium pilosum TaxID=2952 RepID=A0A812NJJ9_SYMPI|nr:gpr180 [Symbiodinium pilosum]